LFVAVRPGNINMTSTRTVLVGRCRPGWAGNAWPPPRLPLVS
jgi:hypothetical protein